MSLSFFKHFLVTAALIAGACALHGQTAGTISRSEANDMTLTGPQSDSPFYIERQEAQAALANAGREGYGMYVPKPPHPPVQQQMRKFFKGMFGILLPC